MAPRSCYKQEESENPRASMEFPSSDHHEQGNGGCSTPKGPRFRIPEMLSCPPAPMKKRSKFPSSKRSSPIALFAPPDLELFFLFAFHNVST